MTQNKVLVVAMIGFFVFCIGGIGRTIMNVRLSHGALWRAKRVNSTEAAYWKLIKAGRAPRWPFMLALTCMPLGIIIVFGGIIWFNRQAATDWMHVRARVQAFCASDFNGDGAARVDFFDHTHDTEFGENSVDYYDDNLDLVASYKVASVAVNGDTATAVVHYKMLGEFRQTTHIGYRSDGTVDPEVKYRAGDQFVANREPDYTERLIWARKGGQWLLESSPDEKVAPKVLRRILQNQLDMEEQILRTNVGMKMPFGGMYLRADRDRTERKIEILDGLLKGAG